MAGGGNRRDDGSSGINSKNVFAALDSLRRKKKSGKDHGSSKNKGSSENQKKGSETQVFWAPAPLTVKSWADVDDDDDYFATTEPPQSIWVSSKPQQDNESLTPVEVSESEEEGLDEGDDEVEEELEPETEPEIPAQTESVIKKPPQASLAPKDTERQLSKKELKKKGLEEIDAALAELGYENETGSQDEARGVKQEKKSEQHNGDVEKKDNAPGDGKNTKKKKKKKDKSSKEVKEQGQSNGSDANNGPDEAAGTEPAEEDASASDLKERLKKVASMKKKKSNKEMDAAARAAAIEAAARSAKLAAAKKKEKNHYNQQPTR